MNPPARALAGTRTALRVLMLLLFMAWFLDVPARAGLALYTEQFLAAAVGLAVALVLVCARGARRRTLVAAGLAVAVFGIVALRYPELQAAMVPAQPHAVALAAAMALAVLEATRRRLGWFLPGLLLAVAGWVFAGDWLPASLQPRPVAGARVLVYVAFDSNALLGRILAAAAVVVVPFVVFGALFAALRGSDAFAALVGAVVGRRRGDTAKVALAGSAAFGMVSGSAVANVTAVGSVSIPLMVRAGYPREVAAGIEAVASTGGQLMPPVLGAAAFLMAEFLAMPYRSIALATLLPALLFYAALWMAVGFQARNPEADGAAIAPGSSAPVRAATLSAVLPVAVLVYLLVVTGWRPDAAVGAGLMTQLLLYLTGPCAGLAGRFRHAAAALVAAMDPVADIVLIGAAAGMVIGLLDVSGLSFTLALQVLDLGQGSLALLLAASALISLLLGMGMPTVGVYALLAMLIAPALVEHGVTPVAAHLYVLYFGMFSMITPPVALASVAAAAIADADPWRTSLASLRLSAGAYVVPIAFVLQPELLLAGSAVDALVAMLRVLLAVTLVTSAVAGGATRLRSTTGRVLALLLALANIVPPGDVLPGTLAALGFVGGLALLTVVRPLRAAPA